MSSPAEPDEMDGNVHLEATAYGPATINQAGRDQHFHYGTGVRRVAAAGDGADGGCPYPGLASFTAEQAPWFFGRDRLTGDLIGRLNESLAGGGPVMLVAASGAGKSSLLRAGVLPKIAGGGLTPAGSRHWPRVVFTPGAHPVRQAVAALLAACPDAGGPGVPPDPGTGDLDVLLTRAVEATAGQAASGARAVIVVDQFEELFRLCDSEDERGAFISWLCQSTCPDSSDGPAALVACAVRADFYPDCTRYPQLRQALQDSQVIVGAMSPDELRQAITCPAEAAGLDIEPGLAELLLADLRAGHPPGGGGGLAADDGAGRLPLLAHALQAIWLQRHGSTLTVDGYRAAGGIEHAIAESAERVFARLDSAGQREARALFLRLVKIGDTSSEDIRRPVTRPDLAGGSSTAAAVIDAYTASRLLTVSRDAVQITHEALLRAWPRLAGWLDDDRGGNLMRQRLEDDAADWDRAGRDPSRLYRGARTETAAAWVSSHSPELTGTARHFLAVSRRLTRRTRIIQRSGITILAVLALVTTVTSVVAFQQRSAAIGQRDLATQQRDLAIFNEVQAEALQARTADPSLSAQLTLAAYRMKPTQDLASQLLSTENTPLSIPIAPSPSAPIFSAAFSPDGRTLASSNASAGVQLWDVANAAAFRPLGPPLPGSDSGSPFTAFSPDGRILATSGVTESNGGGTQLWDVTDPAHPRPIGQPFTTNGIFVFSATFSPDGHIMANIGDESTPSSEIQLWNVADPAHPQPLGSPIPAVTTATTLAFSPDGILATIGNNGTAQLWDVNDHARPRPLGRPLTAAKDRGIASVVFGPGGILATGDNDGTAQLWDVTVPTRPRPLGHPLNVSSSGPIGLLTFSPDGRTLATVGPGTIQLWNVADLADPQLVGQPLNVSTSGVDSVAFSPDGRTLASGEGNGTIRLWNIPQTVMPGNSDPIDSATFSPDGRSLATIDTNGTIRLWNMGDQADPKLSGQLADSGGPGDSVAFSAGGRTLAAYEESSQGNGAVQLWDVAAPAHPRALGRIPISDGDGIAAAAFSPDGRTLAVPSFTSQGVGTIQLWDVADPARPQPTGLPITGNSEIFSVAFSPDGHILAADDSTGDLILWNVTNIADPLQLGTSTTGNISITGFIQSMVFSPDGRVLATLTTDGTVQLWKVANLLEPRQVSQLPTITTGLISSVAFSSDDALATGDDDGTIQLWNVTDLAHPQPIGQPLSGSTPITSVTFSPDGILASGTTAGETFLWNLNVGHAIQRICTAAKGSLTAQQWHQHIPQLPYQSPCTR